jgi:hypothetical protein
VTIVMSSEWFSNIHVRWVLLADKLSTTLEAVWKWRKASMEETQEVR